MQHPMRISAHRVIDLADIPISMSVEQIAHSLSMQCRFNGHGQSFYSVAQHSVLCCDLAPDQLKPYALFHDANEVILGDITTPVQETFIHQQPLPTHGLLTLPYANTPASLHTQIQSIDKSALMIEFYHLFEIDTFETDTFDSAPIHDILTDQQLSHWRNPLSPNNAKHLFLDTLSNIPL